MLIAIAVLSVALVALSIIVSLRIADLVLLVADHDACIRKLTNRVAALEGDKTDLRSFRDDITTLGKRIESIESRPADDSSLAARVTGLEEALASHVSADQLAHEAIEVDRDKKTRQIDGLQNRCRGLEKADEEVATRMPTFAHNAVSAALYKASLASKDQASA